MSSVFHYSVNTSHFSLWTHMRTHTQKHSLCVSFELQKRQCKGVIPLTIELGGEKLHPGRLTPYSAPGLQPLLWASLVRSKPLY